MRLPREKERKEKNISIQPLPARYWAHNYIDTFDMKLPMNNEKQHFTHAGESSKVSLQFELDAS